MTRKQQSVTKRHETKDMLTHSPTIVLYMAMAKACLKATRKQSSGTERQQIKEMLTHSSFLKSCMRMAGVVPRSDTDAVKWFKKSTDQKHAKAQFDLSVMYRKGQGVPQ